jgi:hypothetical protein
MTRPLFSGLLKDSGSLKPMESVSTAPRPEEISLEAPVPFDPTALRLKRDLGQWQLWSGNQLLKEFGSAEADAHEAMRLFRELKVNSRGSVGGVFEYYLLDGKAPSVALSRKQVVPFDPRTLRAELMGGQWVLRDANAVLYNFGPAKQDAEKALAICQKYGFNQLGVVGHPTPTFKYLLKDPNPRLTSRNSNPIVPASFNAPATEAPRRQIYVPGTGPVGSAERIDYRRLDLRRDNGEWVLANGSVILGRFGAQERVARVTLETLQQFRCTEICRFGSSKFGFCLSNGRPPQGTLVGLSPRPLRMDRLHAVKDDRGWTINEDQRVLFHLGDDEIAAQHALAAIQHFQFDTFVPIGNGRMGELVLMLKTR